MRQLKDLKIGDELYAPTRQGFDIIKIENIKRSTYNAMGTGEVTTTRINDRHYFDMESKQDRSNSLFINYEDMIKNLPIQYFINENIKLDEDIEGLLKIKSRNKLIIHKWKNLTYGSKIDMLKKSIMGS